VHGNTLDSYGGQVFCSPKVTQACLHIIKQTPAEMSLKIEAFCVAGLGGKVPIISRAMYIYTNNFVAAMSTTGVLDKLNCVQSQKAI